MFKRTLFYECEWNGLPGGIPDGAFDEDSSGDSKEGAFERTGPSLWMNGREDFSGGYGEF